ncbi:MAG: hypothetical protein LC118_12380 [Dehalococcoidia bacterium]|nr:hypothetical protein [Dehalococcoidia bacterium]
MRGAKAGWRSPIRWGLAAACAALLTVATAQADGGEAGLVVQTDGKADTYCVALPDGGLNGEQLLSAAGYRVESVKSSSGNAVCALNEIGCFGATDFNSCYCKSFPPDSTYWAFFIMKGGCGSTRVSRRTGRSPTTVTSTVGNGERAGRRVRLLLLRSRSSRSVGIRPGRAATRPHR